MRRETVALRVSWICLLIVSIGILAFGLLAALTSQHLLYRADGVALTGMGLFGTLLTLIPFRRRERWAWAALWFYPVFWLTHLLGRLPPSKDHLHQVAFIVMSLVGLLLPADAFLHAKLPDSHSPAAR